jgi:hypothetical protein
VTPFVLMYPAYMGYLNWCYQIVISGGYQLSGLWVLCLPEPVESKGLKSKARSELLIVLLLIYIIIQRFTAMIQFRVTRFA